MAFLGKIIGIYIALFFVIGVFSIIDGCKDRSEVNKRKKITLGIIVIIAAFGITLFIGVN